VNDNALSQHTNEFYIMKKLTGRIKSLILSTKPPVIDVNNFINHVYYVQLYDDINKIKVKYDITKDKLLEYIKKAVIIVISELIACGRYSGDLDTSVRFLS